MLLCFIYRYYVCVDREHLIWYTATCSLYAKHECNIGSSLINYWRENHYQSGTIKVMCPRPARSCFCATSDCDYLSSSYEKIHNFLTAGNCLGQRSLWKPLLFSLSAHGSEHVKCTSTLFCLSLFSWFLFSNYQQYHCFPSVWQSLLISLRSAACLGPSELKTEGRDINSTFCLLLKEM